MNITIAWIWGKRLSIRGRGFKYWVQYGAVRSNTTRNPRHALRWACRIKPNIEEKRIRVLSLRFEGQERFYSMAYQNLELDRSHIF